MELRIFTYMIANVKMPRLCAKCYQCCKCHGPWQKYHKCHGSEQNANTAMVLGNDATNATNLSTMLPIPRPFTKCYKCHGSEQNANAAMVLGNNATNTTALYKILQMPRL